MADSSSRSPLPSTRNGRTTAPATWQPAPHPITPEPVPDESPTAVAAGNSPPAGDASIPAPGEREAAKPQASPAGTGAAADGPGTGETASAPARDGTPGCTASDSAPDTASAGDSTTDTPAVGGYGGDPAPGDGQHQPAVTGEAAAQLREMASAATRAMEALDGGDIAAALTATEAACAAAAQGRRLLKAAASGRKPRGTSPAARPGQLRDLVAAHLAAHPDADFTPHQIGQVLTRSSGAVANAPDKLTSLGQAQMTCEKPRRYQAAAKRPAPADTTVGSVSR